MHNTASESDRHLRQRLSNHAPWGVVHVSAEFCITGVNRWVLETYATTEDQILNRPIETLFRSAAFDIGTVLKNMTADNDLLTEPALITICNDTQPYVLLIRKSSDTATYSISFAHQMGIANEQSMLGAVQRFISNITQHQTLESINTALQDSFRPLNIGVFCALVQEPNTVSRQLKSTRDVEPYDFLGVWIFGRKIPLNLIANGQTVSRLLGISHIDSQHVTTKRIFETVFEPNMSRHFADRFSMAGLNRIKSFPLQSGDQNIGMLSLMGPFIENETLKQFSTYIHFIQGIFAQLYERSVLETQVVRLQRLNNAIRHLADIMYVDELYRSIATSAADIFNATYAFVLTRSIDDTVAHVSACHGANVPNVSAYDWQSVALQTHRTDSLETSNDVFLKSIASAFPIRVALTVPLTHNGRCFAVVIIADIHEELLSASDIIYAQQFGEYVASYHARLLLTESLDQSEKRYRFLLNESSNPVFVVNHTDQILHINHAGRRLIGIDDESDIALRTILTPDSMRTWHAEKHRLDIREVDNVFWSGEISHYLRGTTVPIEAEVICVRHGENYLEYLITMHDITDRLHAEQQHRLRENELDLFQHITSVVNSSLDLDVLLERSLDIFDEVNFANLYGILLLDDQRLPYLAAHRHVPEWMIERVKSDPLILQGGMDLVLSRTEQDDYTSVVPVKNILNNELVAQLGNLIGAKISVENKTIGAILAARPFVSAPDFTPRDMQILHAIANQLARSITNARLHYSLQQAADRNSMLYNDTEKIRAHLSSVIENSPDALVLLHRSDWTMRVLNEDPFIAWGYAFGFLQQQPLQSICSPEQVPVMNEHLARIGGQPSYSFECTLLRADGSDFTALISANTVNADEILLSIRDITPMRRLENRIKQREKLALLGQMIATVAHELNNPIAVIRGIAQLQLLQPLTPELTHDFEVIDRTSQRAGRIVQQLRMLGQPQKNEFMEVDLNELIEHIAMQQRTVFAHAHIEYRYSRSTADTRVYGDPAQLEQIVVNIIDNAVRAMQHVTHPRILSLKLQSTANDIDLIVDDTGMGIDAGARARLFEPFFTTRQVGEGLGLGLAIVQTIVTQHHGTIHYENRPSGGARFTITLPTIRAPRLTIAKQTVASDTYLTIIELLRELLQIPIIEVDAPSAPADVLVIDASLLQSYPTEVRAHPFLCVISPREIPIPSFPGVVVAVCTLQMDATLIRQQLQTLIADRLLP